MSLLLYPREKIPQSTAYEAGRFPEPVWGLWRRQLYLSTSGKRTADPTARNLISAAITLSGPLPDCVTIVKHAASHWVLGGARTGITLLWAGVPSPLYSSASPCVRAWHSAWKCVWQCRGDKSVMSGVTYDLAWEPAPRVERLSV